MTAPVHLVLASASPRRRELLGGLGVALTCDPADVDESRLEGESPAEHVLRVARSKARTVAARHAGEPVLGADTIVVLGDEVLGKPADRRASGRMLDLLSGRTHTVMTAVCVVLDAVEAAYLESASVTFVTVTPALREWYVATGEGDDKAGAYAVQGVGGALVARVDGNVQAVMGLPLAPLPSLLSRIGLAVTADGPRLALSRRP